MAIETVQIMSQTMSILSEPQLDINHIYGTLYQGAWPPFGNKLAELGFHVLVLTAKDNQDADRYDEIEVICAPGDDDMRPSRLERFLPGWKDAAQKVVTHVRNNKNVLVTCMAGQNRSGLVVALALQELTQWSGKKVVNFIQSRRMWALNNTTFEDYIIKTFPVSEDEDE